MKKPVPILSLACSFASISAALSLSVWSLQAHAAMTSTAKPSNAAIYAVVHIDVEPKDMKAAIPLLTSYAQRAVLDPGLQHIDILQQENGGNHFTLLENFRSQAAYDTFVSKAYVKQMRASIQPMLGSPFDERLHSAIMVR